MEITNVCCLVVTTDPCCLIVTTDPFCFNGNYLRQLFIGDNSFIHSFIHSFILSFFPFFLPSFLPSFLPPSLPSSIQSVIQCWLVCIGHCPVAGDCGEMSPAVQTEIRQLAFPWSGTVITDMYAPCFNQLVNSISSEHTTASTWMAVPWLWIARQKVWSKYHVYQGILLEVTPWADVPAI